MSYPSQRPDYVEVTHRPKYLTPMQRWTLWHIAEGNVTAWAQAFGHRAVWVVRIEGKDVSGHVVALSKLRCIAFPEHGYPLRPTVGGALSLWQPVPKPPRSV